MGRRRKVIEKVTEKVVEDDNCKHPYTSLAWVWDNVFHCWTCGELIGEDDDIGED